MTHGSPHMVGRGVLTAPRTPELLGPQFSPALIGAMKQCKRTWRMGFPVISDALLLPHLVELQNRTIARFCEAVEREAEGNMLKTGKLEGAHYAAMRRLRDTLRRCEDTPALPGGVL